MNREPIILALETALGKGSLSLLRGEREIDFQSGEHRISQAEDLLRSISRVLEKNDLDMGQVDLIAVSEGPGSFTGIRVGLATAQALALGGGGLIRGVSVLEAIAFGAGSSSVCAVVPLARGQVIWQEFSGERATFRKSLPVVGTLPEFIAKTAESRTQVAKIVTEASVFAGLKQPGTNLPEKIEIINASDNAAKFVGLFSLFSLLNSSSQTQVLPRYFLEAEIGGKEK